MPAPPFKALASLGWALSLGAQSIQIQILLYMGQPQLHVLRVGMRYAPQKLLESAATAIAAERRDYSMHFIFLPFCSPAMEMPHNNQHT